MTTAYLVYATGAVLFMIFMSFRTPVADAKTTTFVAILWPLSLLVMLLILSLWTIKWDFNLIDAKTKFGYRKPVDDWPGFAVTVFHLEFQFWKKRI